MPTDLYTVDLDDFTSHHVSSSSSGDQDGAPSSPGVVVTVSRQDSSSSGDAFVDVRTSGATESVTAGDEEHPGRDGGRDEPDSWSMMSSPGVKLVGDGHQDSDGRLRARVDGISVSASDPNIQAHYEWLNGIDDTPVASESRVLADVQPTLDVEQLELDASETQTLIHEPCTKTADDAESSSTGPRVKSPATSTNVTPVDDVEHARRSSSSSSSSPHHHRLFSSERLSTPERLFVDKELLLNNAALETS